MVEQREAELNRIFAALSHPVRRDLLSRLAHGQATISELAEPYEVSFAAISKQLQVLERAGLVQRRILGREHHIQLEPEPLAEATEWLVSQRRFWRESLDALQTLLEEASS